MKEKQKIHIRVSYQDVFEFIPQARDFQRAKELVEKSISKYLTDPFLEIADAANRDVLVSIINGIPFPVIQIVNHPSTGGDKKDDGEYSLQITNYGPLIHALKKVKAQIGREQLERFNRDR